MLDALGQAAGIAASWLRNRKVAVQDVDIPYCRFADRPESNADLLS
jgi:hypothetical protein